MATRPAPRYAKDPIALAKLRRERAFSSPAPKVKVKAKPTSYNRFGIGVKPGDSVGQDVIGGTSGPISEATGLGDFINRLGRNYTVDVGDATSRVIQDTFLGGKGKSSLIDNGGVSLAEFARNPSAGVAKFITNNALNNSDAMQVAAPGDFIGAGSLAKGAATVAGKIVKPLIPIVSSKAGKLAAASIAAASGAGVINSDDAQAGVPGAGSLGSAGIKGSKLLERLGEGIYPLAVDAIDSITGTTAKELKAVKPYLADPRGLATLFTGGDKPDQNIINWVRKNLGDSDTSFVVPETQAGKVKTVQDSLIKTATGAVDTRQPAQLEELNTYLATTSHGTQLKPIKPIISSASAEEALAIAEATHGIGASAGKFTNKAHIMENDHFIGSSFITDYINRSADKIRSAGQKVSKDWVDEHNALIDWANSSDNMTRVGRFWNQVKSGKDFDTAMKEFGGKYPTAAKQQFQDAYLTHVADAQSALTQNLGTKFSTNLLSAWKDPARNEAVRVADAASSKRRF